MNYELWMPTLEWFSKFLINRMYLYYLKTAIYSDITEGEDLDWAFLKEYEV